MLVATLGTPWAIDLDGGLLVLEDVAEPLYRLDRMLTHLGLSGSLAGVRGVVIGSMKGTDEGSAAPSALASRVAGWTPGRPVAWGLEVGHGGLNRTLPLGAVARIEAEPARLTLDLSGTWT
jgi:muramoyltetrapeptide carboxypeptidase